MNRIGWLVAALVLILAAVEWAAGEERMSHSGRIVAIDPDTATIVVEEVGPWRVKDGATEITRLTIAITDETTLRRARRSDAAAPAGWPGGFVEESAEPWTIYETDFVTVQCLHQDHRLVALDIMAVTIPER